ncbi:MAG: uracil-DNA glycosylase [Phycisphaerae bacterium]|nr:uracil-DNA glycosylase [Phycisphaerae bacterium]
MPSAGSRISPEPHHTGQGGLFGQVEQAQEGVGGAPGVAIGASRQEPIGGEALPTEAKRLRLKQLDEQEVRACVKCPLHAGRTQTVFGEGDVDAQLMFIGEGPGETEDQTGRPFVGRAGELLDKMIAGMGLRREQVYICNVVKCRPPNNRAPLPDETAACASYLERQIETIRPKVIVTLGAPAAKFILGNDRVAISRVRGTWHEYRGIRVMPTFHPAYILRVYTPEVRGQVWSDLQKVMEALGLPGRREGK